MVLDDLQELFDQIADWGEATFPTSFDAGRIAHIRKELAELEAAPHSGEEMADIILILCHQARAHGVDLAYEIDRKFRIVKERKWGPPDENGVVEHVRSATPPLKRRACT